MLTVRQVNYVQRTKDKKNKDTFSLKNINFTLESGYIMALIGFNGAGKTTLLDILQGVIIPDSGSVFLDSLDLSKNKNEALQQIGFVSERMQFFETRTVLENAELLGILYDNFNLDRCMRYMEELGITKKEIYGLYGDASTGQKYKIQLAFALSHFPKVLLLDEPIANLDPHAKEEWIEWIQKLVDMQEMSVIITTHSTSILDQIVDYILVLEKGNQVAFMDREQMENQYGEIELGQLLLKLAKEE